MEEKQDSDGLSAMCFLTLCPYLRKVTFLVLSHFIAFAIVFCALGSGTVHALIFFPIVNLVIIKKTIYE